MPEQQKFDQPADTHSSGISADPLNDKEARCDADPALEPTLAHEREESRAKEAKATAKKATAKKASDNKEDKRADDSGVEKR
jgi:hypothetical protein